MNHSQTGTNQPNAEAGGQIPPNGPAAAALLAAGVGCALIGIMGLVADACKPVAKLLTFSRSVGPLSGVSSVAIFLWLGLWWILASRWRVKTLAMRGISVAAFSLLALGILLTFPPIADCLQGK